jgi:hypothetical protein
MRKIKIMLKKLEVILDHLKVGADFSWRIPTFADAEYLLVNARSLPPPEKELLPFRQSTNLRALPK